MTFRNPILFLTLSGLALGACTDPALVNADDPNKNLKQGALLGGLAGVGAGLLTGGSTIKAGVIGAGVGAGVGVLMDKQEADLREAVKDDRVQIENTGDRLIVTLPQDITFDSDSAVVRSGLRDDIGAISGNLKEYPNSVVQVLGHTDNTGEAAYNLELSKARAEAVASVMMDYGVAFDRIQTIGRGEDQPLASNLNEEGKAQNRRVEIVILPNG